VRPLHLYTPTQPTGQPIAALPGVLQVGVLQVKQATQKAALSIIIIITLPLLLLDAGARASTKGRHTHLLQGNGNELWTRVSAIF